MDKKNLFPTLPILRAFYEVGRHRSFKAAADYLGVSQPTLVKQVGELEACYNANLFVRGRGNNRLTDLGLQLMPLCRSVIMGVKEIDEFLLSHGQLNHGSLTIGAVGPYHVTQALKRFTQFFPNIKIKVIYGPTEKVKSLLVQGEVDVALFVNNSPLPGFRGFLCVEDQLVAIIPKTQPLSSAATVTLGDFQDQVFISREPGSLTRQLIEHAMGAAKVTPRSTLEIGSREAVREAVIQGIGISVVTEHEHIDHPAIVARSFAGISLGMRYSFVVSNERLGSRLIQSFLKCAEPVLQEPLYS